MADRTRLSIGSRSAAEDLAFIALQDVAEIVAELRIVDWRLVGGHMVLLHVPRAGAGPELYRATADADLGVPPLIAKSGGIIESLQDRGYVRVTGNRFRRRISELDGRIDSAFASVDILVPAYTSKARDDRVISDKLTTVEVPGLALALARPPTFVDVDVSLWTGGSASASSRLPDETSAFVLKAFAWRQRGARNDAGDIWRLLEAMRASGRELDGLPPDVAVAAGIVENAFSHPTAPGVVALADEQGLTENAARALAPRIQALLKQALLRPRA